METKVCKTCGLDKPIDKFYKRIHNNTVRYTTECKDCICISRSNHYILNKDSVIKRNSEYRSLHKKERSIREKNFRIIHKEEINQKDRDRYIRTGSKKIAGQNYYLLNRDKILKERVVYYSTPEGKAVMARVGHKRRCAIESVKNDLTLNQWNKILEMQNNKCPGCNKEFNENLKPHRDHIVPISYKWYGLTFGNVQALCRSCNAKKHKNVDFMKAIDTLLI